MSENTSGHERGSFGYDFLALSGDEVLVGLKVDVPTHEAFVAVVYTDKRVAARLVKLARAGLDDDFEKAVMEVLFEDREQRIPTLTDVNYQRLARLLVLAWRDA